MNSDLTKLLGTPCNASDGCMTRPVAISGPGNLGMGAFSPRKGANPRGKYVVDGVNAGKGVGGSRSSRRSAGESPDSSV